MKQFLKKMVTDGRYEIVTMIGFFLIAFLFNLKNPEPTLSSMSLVSKICGAISGIALVIFLIRTWIIRK